MRWTILAVCAFALAGPAFAQTECNGWGGIRGIRVGGELMPFSTTLRAIRPGGSETTLMANEQSRNSTYRHLGAVTTCSGSLAFRDGQLLNFTESIHDAAPGTADVAISCTAMTDLHMDGLYFVVSVPPGPARQLEIALSDRPDIVLADGRQIYLSLALGNLAQGNTIDAAFTIKARFAVNDAPVNLKIDSTRPGPVFDGIGGNFRLQDPTNDPPAIQYNLDHLPVTWGRVAMPLSLWHGDDSEPEIAKAMEMARDLSRRRIPVIVSSWTAPDWALGPEALTTQNAAGRRLRGRAILPEKTDAVCDAIAAYLLFLRDHYATEADFFSFNESNLGIDVRQTPEEHADMIRRLGVLFAAKSLKTKLLLGDTSDANATDFAETAMRDADAMRFVGAVSFHSWRGATDQTLATWREIARNLRVPLFVAEAGTDPAAYKYPSIFLEPWYAIDEINLYVRICALCQPTAILQWQLTHDYSVLSNGLPTQRFWQLKQLGLTPPGAASLPIATDAPAIACCAFSGPAPGQCAVHIVNTGATRQVNITGLPPHVRQMREFLTDANHGMTKTAAVPITQGNATIKIQPLSFVTLIGEP
jgi:hypothetical protein